VVQLRTPGSKIMTKYQKGQAVRGQAQFQTKTIIKEEIQSLEIGRMDL